MQKSISLKEYADIKDSTIKDVVQYALGKGITIPERPDYMLDASLMRQIDPIYLKFGKTHLDIITTSASKESGNTLKTPTLPIKKPQEKKEIKQEKTKTGEKEIKVYLGMLKWYKNDRGYGVISTMLPLRARTAEVFFHCASWKGHESISTSRPLAFKIKQRPFKEGFETYWCDVFDGSPDQWKMLFDNIEYNLLVNTEYGLKNLMCECISTICSSDVANNFLEEYNTYHNTNLVLFDEISVYLAGGKNVCVREYQDFIKSLIRGFSFEEKSKLFKNGQLGLYAFSDEECFEMANALDRSQYFSIKETNPSLFLKIVEKKIKTYVAGFDFQYRPEKKSYSDQEPSQYEILNSLFDDFNAVATEEESKRLQEEIGVEIEAKWACLSERIQEIFNRNDSAYILRLRELFTFPKCFAAETTKNLKSNADDFIQKNYGFNDYLNCMSAGIIDIHEDYVLKKINLINPDNINLVVDSESRFTDAFSLRVLFEYLQRTKDADTVLRWYNELPTSQSEERTATIKSYISETYLNPKSTFVEGAVKYLPLLGQDFVFTLTKDYLIRTHCTKPILNQLACAKGEYYENLSTFLFGFHKNYEKFIDENFIEPFCKSSMSISHPSLNNEYMIAIIKLYVSNFSSYEKAMKFAKDYNSEVATQIENHLVSILDRNAYMQLWEEGICEQLPDGYLDDYFDDNEYKYEKANKWLEKGRLGKEAIAVALERTLKKIKGITFYRYFKTEYLIYFYVLDKQWDMPCLSLIDDKHKEWFDWTRKLSYKDFGAVCSIFVLMPESIQIKLLKYVFLCMAAEKYSIRAVDLRNLENCLPQYKNYDSSDKPSMSLSIAVIIESLCVYEKEGHFISDKDFFTLLYKYCKNGNSKVTAIDSFFDRCPGKFKRYYPYRHKINRFIYPIKDNRGGIQYIINFNYDAKTVTDVKKITGCRYLPNYKVWFAPESSLSEIENFAKNFQFLLLHKEYNIGDIGKSAERILENYTDSEYREAVRGISELKEWKEDMPHITFCEGRESQKKEEADVWWCVGHNPCNNCAITLHPIEKWQDYTLYDFCKILGFDLVEENRYGHFSSGRYALFITSINRFNNLLEHLYCRECGEILFPVESNYSVVGATTFHCINEKCSQFHKSVYLNHCYKKKCRGLIDSRDEARCPNNLVICKSCGTCCSTEMFRYRLDKLQRTGSQCYFTIRDLIYKIEHNEGHAENQKFYCYHCGALLKGYISNTVCESCGSSINYKSY